MFGGYCYYVDDKVIGLVNDGHVFVKRSSQDEKLQGWADLAPAYPGAKDTWRLPPGALRDEPDRVLAVIADVAAALKTRPR